VLFYLAAKLLELFLGEGLVVVGINLIVCAGHD
jgi:hypothetical protein